MTYKYGVFQSSSKSCVLYKEDKDGNQSTFNIFVTPKEDEKDTERVIAFIDNEQMKKDNWAKTEVKDLKDILDAFGGWATDAPIVFELEAHKSLSNCLRTILKK